MRQALQARWPDEATLDAPTWMDWVGAAPSAATPFMLSWGARARLARGGACAAQATRLRVQCAAWGILARGLLRKSSPPRRCGACFGRHLRGCPRAFAPARAKSSECPGSQLQFRWASVYRLCNSNHLSTSWFRGASVYRLHQCLPICQLVWAGSSPSAGSNTTSLSAGLGRRQSIGQFNHYQSVSRLTLRRR